MNLFPSRCRALAAVAAGAFLTLAATATAASAAPVAATAVSNVIAVPPFDPNDPPNVRPRIVSVSASPASGSAPLSVQFSADAYDPDGEIVDYFWDFGDGQSAYEASPTHVYQTAGDFTARLTVTDDGGLSANRTVMIHVTGVTNQPPQVSVSATPTAGVAPLIVNFSATASDPDGQIVAYAWDFGDGQTSPEPSPAHTYAAPGTFTARLTVTDNGGASASATITIQALPVGSGNLVHLPWDWSVGNDFIGAGFDGVLDINVEQNGTSTLHAQTRAGGQVFYVPLDVFRAEADFKADQQVLTAKINVYAAGQNIYSLDQSWRDYVDVTDQRYVSGCVPFLYTTFSLGPVDITLYGELCGVFGVDYRFFATGGGHAEARVTPYVDSYAYLLGYGYYGGWDYDVTGGVEGLLRLVGEQANLQGSVDLGSENNRPYADVAWDVSEITSALVGRVDGFVDFCYYYDPYGWPYCFGYTFNIWQGNGLNRQRTLYNGSRRIYLPTSP